MLGPDPSPATRHVARAPPHPGITSGAPEAEGQASAGKGVPAGGLVRMHLTGGRQPGRRLFLRCSPEHGGPVSGLCGQPAALCPQAPGRSPATLLRGAVPYPAPPWPP